MRYQLGIVGGGPAGMMAALIGDRFGIKTILIDDNPALGGQLIKQTHKFFGSKDHYCGYRGFQIGSILREEIAKSKVEGLRRLSRKKGIDDRLREHRAYCDLSTTPGWSRGSFSG